MSKSAKFNYLIAKIATLIVMHVENSETFPHFRLLRGRTS